LTGTGLAEVDSCLAELAFIRGPRAVAGVVGGAFVNAFTSIQARVGEAVVDRDAAL